MTFVTSRLSFGGYAFPAAFMLVYRQQDTTVDVVKLPYQDGSNIPTGTRSEKKISIKGTIGGAGAVDSSGNYITTRDQAEAELNLMSSYLEAGYQQLSVGASPARYLLAQKTSFKATPMEGTSQTAISVEIEFVAQDPRWIATTQSSSTALNGTLTSNGTTIVWPKFTITAAAAGATIQIAPSGYSGIKLVLLNGAVSSGTLIVDTDPRNRASAVINNSGVVQLSLVDYVNTLNNNGDSSFFPYMRPGANALTTTNITAMTTTWSDAWLF